MDCGVIYDLQLTWLVTYTVVTDLITSVCLWSL